MDLFYLEAKKPHNAQLLMVFNRLVRVIETQGLIKEGYFAKQVQDTHQLIQQEYEKHDSFIENGYIRIKEIANTEANLDLEGRIQDLKDRLSKQGHRVLPPLQLQMIFDQYNAAEKPLLIVFDSTNILDRGPIAEQTIVESVLTCISLITHHSECWWVVGGMSVDGSPSDARDLGLPIPGRQPLHRSNLPRGVQKGD